jgi:hypothetical protein
MKKYLWLALALVVVVVFSNIMFRMLLHLFSFTIVFIAWVVILATIIYFVNKIYQKVRKYTKL